MFSSWIAKILLLDLHALDPGLEPVSRSVKLARGLVGDPALGIDFEAAEPTKFRPRQHVCPELAEECGGMSYWNAPARPSGLARRRRPRSACLEHLVGGREPQSNRVLSAAGEREVVLRARDQEAVGGRDLGAKALLRIPGNSGVEDVLVESGLSSRRA